MKLCKKTVQRNGRNGLHIHCINIHPYVDEFAYKLKLQVVAFVFYLS